MEAVRAFIAIFPDSDEQLVKLAQDLVTKFVSLFATGNIFIYFRLNLYNMNTFLMYVRNFVIVEEYVKTRICPEDLLGVLRK